MNRVGVSMVEVGKQLWVYEVAIPFNRVGVSIEKLLPQIEAAKKGRNPLPSGRCFNRTLKFLLAQTIFGRNPLQSGRYFNGN